MNQIATKKMLNDLVPHHSLQAIEEEGEGGVELPGERFEGPVWTKQFTYITWISSHNGGSVRLSDQVESDAVRGLNC